jgi:hypothetical protein
VGQIRGAREKPPEGGGQLDLEDMLALADCAGAAAQASTARAEKAGSARQNPPQQFMD